MTPPDEIYSTKEAAGLLGINPRSVQRRLEAGQLAGVRFGRTWRITALALWRYMGIEADMLALWRDYCREDAVAQREAAARTDAAPSAQSVSIHNSVAPSAARAGTTERVAMALFSKSMS